jgi:hypothetical protein
VGSEMCIRDRYSTMKMASMPIHAISIYKMMTARSVPLEKLLS